MRDMTNIKPKPQLYIILLWIIYTVYLAVFRTLLLFPKDSFVIIVPAITQLILITTFTRLFKENYLFTIKVTSLISCIIVIFWHFSLYHGIPRKYAQMMFLMLPIISTIINYVVNKTTKNIVLKVWKNFAVSSLLTLLNFIIAVISFYIIYFMAL